MLKFLRKLFFVVMTLALLVIIVLLLRVPILKGIGNGLIKEDTKQPVEAIFVLSGAAEERCALAADYMKEGLSPLVITMGEGINPTLETMGIMITDAEVGYQALLSNGIDSASIKVLRRGTSTFEESEEILGYVQREEFTRIMIVSSKFHTRRLQSVFKEKFKRAGVTTIIQGAEPSRYELERWWESEEGLIFVNNEYLKRIYYWIKY